MSIERIDRAIEVLCDLDHYDSNLFETFNLAWPFLSDHVREKVIAWGQRHFADDASEDQFAFLSIAGAAAYLGEHWALSIHSVLSAWTILTEDEDESHIVILGLVEREDGPTVH